MRMIVMIFVLLLTANVAVASNGEPLNACQLAQGLQEYDRKSVQVHSPIVIGPHDEYLAAVDCSPEVSKTEYLFLSYDEGAPSVKRLVRLLQKQAKRSPENQVVATFTATVETASAGKFGAISAHAKLTITNVSAMSVQKCR